MMKLPGCFPAKTCLHRATGLFTFVLLGFFHAPAVWAQWSVGAGGGTAVPVTGYSRLVRPGWQLYLNAGYRPGNSRLMLGASVDFTRLTRDKLAADGFGNARLTVVPLLATASLDLLPKGRLTPYLGAGMGASLYNLTYDTSPTQGTAQTNVSFTLQPRLGVRHTVTPQFGVVGEVNAVLLTDGPPIGVPEASKMTGYVSVRFGLAYQFTRRK